MKMVTKTGIFILRTKSLDQNSKNHFPISGIFKEILVIVAEHKYIYIAEIKSGKKKICSFKMMAETFFCHIAKKCLLA